MKNQYFRAVKVFDDNSYQILSCIHIKQDIDIWENICEKYLNTNEYAQMAYKDPYGSIYRLDIKEYLRNDFPEVLSLLSKPLNENIDGDNIQIWLGTTHDYRIFDEKFDSEMDFLEYINSEICEMDKNRLITNQILESAGFEKNHDISSDVIKNEYGIDDYVSYRFWTDKIDKNNPIKIDIDNGLTNSDRKWWVHIDNQDGCSIGSAEIDNVYQFNMLMKLFDSKFKL